MKKSVVWMQKRLVAHVEDHLGWGRGTTWTNKDFGELSELILKNTGKQLSVTTLKRVWGRAETVANPSVSTYDILSEFVGYLNWRDFQQKNGLSAKKVSKRAALNFLLLGGGALAGLLLWFIFWNKEQPEQLIEPKSLSPRASFSAEDITFLPEKVSSGYPNTVIFNYDLGMLPYDSLCIQQYWDESKRIPLNKSAGLVTSTYYLPGYFLAKLIADHRVLKEYELYIPTEGWQAALLGEPDNIVYLQPDELVFGDILTVRPQVLSQMDRGNNPLLYLAHLSPNPSVDGQNFKLSTTFRMPRPGSKSICQYVRMVVTGTREVISLTFSIPGCVGDLNFFIDQEMVSGRNHDFSAFGREAQQWTQCSLEVTNGKLTIFLNGKEAYQRRLTVDLGRIGGIQWYFEGLPEIQELTLEDQRSRLNLMGHSE